MRVCLFGVISVGDDTGSAYRAADNDFNGTVVWVQIDIDEAADDPDHTISPEQRLSLAMAQQ
jgi:fructose-specific component phosphotransferase system IIB-like protein